MLSFDTDTGACSMTCQFDGGYKRSPGFSRSEREMIIIEGELKVGDKTCRKPICTTTWTPSWISHGRRAMSPSLAWPPVA